MPLAVSFTAACARGLGLGNGEAPRVPTSVSVTAGVVTVTATYTITISTFPLSRVEYRISRGADAGQYLGSLPGASGSNSSGTISTRLTTAGVSENLLHATTYTIYFRAVDASGQVGPETAGNSFTTGAEVGPTAAAPTLDSLSVTSPTAPYIDITWAAGTAGTYPIETRQYSVVAGTGAAGTFTTVTGSTGTVRVTTTAAGVAILPNTAYRVYMKYTASTPTPPPTSSTASADITTAAEVTADAISAQASITTASTGLTFDQHRTQFVIFRGNVPNSTTYTQKYQFAYGTSVNPTNWADFPTSGTASSVTITGLTSNVTYYARTRAISTVTSAAGTASGNASVQLNAALPPTPTLAFRSMSSSSYGTAQFTISDNGGSTTAVYIFRRPTSGTNSGATAVLLGTGSQDISGYTSDGGTEYYVAYNFNRHGEASASSNELRWTRPQKNVSKTWRGNDFGQAYYFPDYTYVIATNACEPYRLSYLFGSGYPSSDEVPGYVRVDYMQATFKCGNTLKRPADNSNFDRASLCNTTNLRFSYADAGSESSASSARPTNAFGGTDPLGATDTTLFRVGLSVGGSSINNKVFWAQMAAGTSKAWNSGCSLSLAGDYMAGKLLELVGVQTIAGVVA